MKKKNLRAIIAGLVLMVSLSVAINLGMAFAEGNNLELLSSYPQDGAKNAAVENLGAKLTFSNEVNSEANQAANNKCFKLINPENKELPIKVYYNPKDHTQVLVVYDVDAGGQLTSRTSETYHLLISGDFMDNDGNTIGDDIDITFTTINQKRNNRVYLVILLLMMAGMSIMNMRQMRKKEAAAAAPTVVKDEPFNPYKEAKRTGKSVEEVIALHDKEMARLEAKYAKKAGETVEYVFDDEDEGVYKVKGPRPASAAGSKFVEARKQKSKNS